MLFALTAVAGELAATPQCVVTVFPEKLLPGQEAMVEYQFTWPDGSSDWVLIPDEAPVIPEVDLSLKVTRYRKEKDEKQVILEYHAAVKKSGQATIPPIEFRFARKEDAPAGPLSPGATTSVKTQEVVLTFSRPMHLVWVAGVCAAMVLVLAGAGLWWMRRAHRQTALAKEAGSAPQLRERLHGARRLRLDGDLYACLKELEGLVEALSDKVSDAAVLKEKLDLAVRRTGFQAAPPTEDELDGYFKDTERMLARFDASGRQDNPSEVL